ncbi:hypothetical protein M758_6G008900 [Ceratodon purpureus]|nr:hypothetical protein M758_6G008900 [Ceratodon purpureus]
MRSTRSSSSQIHLPNSFPQPPLTHSLALLPIIKRASNHTAPNHTTQVITQLLLQVPQPIHKLNLPPPPQILLPPYPTSTNLLRLHPAPSPPQPNRANSRLSRIHTCTKRARRSSRRPL